MDYGQQPVQPVNTPINEPQFFTAGEGNAPENVNPDAEISLNSDPYDPYSQAPTDSQERSPRNVGNTAISLTPSPKPEIIDFGQPNPENFPEPGPEFEPALGQITSLNDPQKTENEKTSNFDSEAIKTTESLSKSGIKEVDNALMKFKQDDNAADFYQTARDMMEKNMQNSYGELAAWKGKGD